MVKMVDLNESMKISNERLIFQSRLEFGSSLLPYPCGKLSDGRANCAPLRTKLTAGAFDVDCLDDRRLDESSILLRVDRRGL